MPEIGQTISHYRILQKIGAGGMGEVYLADDTTLDRKVALKFLPDVFTRDPERMARFEREAKVLASLNHPNIAAIYGLEQAEGKRFLVLELVEGETLARRIDKGALPVDEALAICRQIAEGLEAAHEKGVIHRDLKPTNVMITEGEKVKILDFGLAKALSDELQSVDSSQSPTLTEAMTRPGVILGTAAYMSPEQAKGKVVDNRADIWAFGVVLFEILTGKQVFTGETVSDTLASVLAREPGWQSLPPNLHPRIRLLLERCLKKGHRDRYGAISDARVDIQEVLADPRGVLVQPTIGAKPGTRLRTILPWAAATLLLGLIISGAAVWILKPTPTSEPKRVMRFEYKLPEDKRFNGELTVSPDGSKFVYGTTNGLYLRFMDALDARLIPGTDLNSVQPFFSPDGKSLGYWSRSDQKLKKVAISGGAPIVLCDTSTTIVDASWYPEDVIVYSDLSNGIMRVSARGGTPETLVKGSFANIAKEGLPLYPQMLPDGKTLLFTNAFDLGDTANMQIVIQSLESGKRKVLVERGSVGMYLPTGCIVYALSNNGANNLFAIPFDLNKLEVTGGSFPVLEGIATGAVSDSGTLVYVPQPASITGAASTASPRNTLVWVDRQGKEESLGAAPDDYSYLKISPDGSKVALTIRAAGNQDIWIWDIPHKTPTRLTFDAADDGSPIWTQDGNRIVFHSKRGGVSGGVYWKLASGIGEAELLASKPDMILAPWSFSRDGKILALSEMSLAPLRFDIGMLSMGGDREMQELLQGKHFEMEPQVSPDGRYMAYQSDESGKGEIHVPSFPNVNEGKWQVSNGGGGSPLWSPDGRELFYRSGDATMAAKVETEPTFKRKNPKILFQGTYLSTGNERLSATPWDIHPNGKKFLMIKPPAVSASESTAEKAAASAPQLKIIFVMNWFEELKERVPRD